MSSFVTDEVIDLTPKAVRTDRALRRERTLNERLFDAAAKVSKTNVVAIVGPQGGAGKTRITFALGSALAEVGRLNVIAMDLDDDYGALLDLVPSKTRQSQSLEALMEQPEDMIPYPRMRSWMSLTRSSMMVLRGPERTSADGDFKALSGMLDGMLHKLGNADLVIMDCAGGVTRPRAEWAISRADQVLVVVRPDAGLDGTVRMTAQALRDVNAVGSLVINRQQSRQDVSAWEGAFATIGCLQNTLRIPDSRRFKRSMDHTNYRLDGLEKGTRLAIKEMAATVGDSLR